MGMTIHVYSHGFVVCTTERRFKWILAAFIRNRLTVEKFQIGKGNKGGGGTVYSAADAARTNIYLHINMLEEFEQALLSQGVRADEYDTVYHRVKKGQKVAMKFIAPFSLSDLQERCLTFIEEPTPIRVAPLQTGKGKTALALYFMCQYGERTLITMNAKYIPRWIQDLAGDGAKVDLTGDDLLVVKGMDQLKKYLTLAKSNDLHFKVMLISNTTLDNFHKDYLANPKEWKKLGLRHITDFYTIFKIGLRIRDEAHEHLHFNFKFDLFTHVGKTLDLSATLIYDDQGSERMSQIIYPIKDRFEQGKWDTYIEVLSVEYSLRPTTKLKWTQGFNGPYNHNQFEMSILKNRVYTDAYLGLIRALVQELFTDVRKPGEKALVYCSTKEMCTKVSAYLQDRFPDLTVNRYIGEDDYENLLTADLVVTTPKSAGTGVDVPKLAVIINSVNISSTQANIQLAGRLRFDDQIVSRYYYMTCINIPHHVKYDREKRHKLKGVVKSLGTLDTAHRL